MLSPKLASARWPRSTVEGWCPCPSPCPPCLQLASPLPCWPSDGEQPSADHQQQFGPDFGKFWHCPTRALGEGGCMLEGQSQRLGVRQTSAGFTLPGSSRGTTGWRQLHDAHRGFGTFTLPCAGLGQVLSLVAQQPLVHNGHIARWPNRSIAV